MLTKEELRILNITRLVPVVVFIISILIIVFITEKNNRTFENDVQEMKLESVLERKKQIEGHVNRVHQFIEEERTQTTAKIRKNIKGRTNEAYEIISSIYENNPTESQKNITKMIKNALSRIRFNDGRGYFFLYHSDGTSIMHPILTHIEGTSLWDLKDVKGEFVIRKLSKIAQQDNEGFLTWWWSKPTQNNVTKEFEKIGYVKQFKPYNWFIGTGEYVADFESDLQKRILTHIKNITFNKNGYVFVIDNYGNYLSHFLDEYIGKNRIDVLDRNGFPITKEIIKVAKKGEGFLSYVGTITPTTGLPSEKMSFIKGYEDWGWAIGSGVYLSEINETITAKQTKLSKKNTQERIQIISLSLVVCVPLFILSLVLSNQIKSRFEDYKNKVHIKSTELIDLNSHLEETVIQRTQKLEDTINDLHKTQKQLVETEKMASMMGLVSGVAHEVNTPFGIVITALSQTEDQIKTFIASLRNNKVTKKELEQFDQLFSSSYTLINNNMQKAVNLINDFKSLAIHDTEEAPQTFPLQKAIQHALSINQKSLKDNHIEMSVNIASNIQLESYFHTLCEVFNQLIHNAIIHAFDNKNQQSNIISIDAQINEEQVAITFLDNGQGIEATNTSKIFEPFYTTKRNTQCTGLGMTILYNRVTHKLHGTIDYDLSTSLGVKVNLSIPKTLPTA